MNLPTPFLPGRANLMDRVLDALGPILEIEPNLKPEGRYFVTPKEVIDLLIEKVNADILQSNGNAGTSEDAFFETDVIDGYVYELNLMHPHRSVWFTFRAYMKSAIRPNIKLATLIHCDEWTRTACAILDSIRTEMDPDIEKGPYTQHELHKMITNAFELLGKVIEHQDGLISPIDIGDIEFVEGYARPNPEWT